MYIKATQYSFNDSPLLSLQSLKLIDASRSCITED